MQRGAARQLGEPHLVLRRQRLEQPEGSSDRLDRRSRFRIRFYHTKNIIFSLDQSGILLLLLTEKRNVVSASRNY